MDISRRKVKSPPVERVGHFKFTIFEHETAADFRDRVLTVAASQEAAYTRSEREAAMPDGVPRTVDVNVRWLPDLKAAHVIVELKG